MDKQENGRSYICSEGWEDGVRAALNSFIESAGRNSVSGGGNAYAVFDFDNSAAIFDASDQLAVYQLMHMAFTQTPEELKSDITLSSPLFSADLTGFGYPGRSLCDWVDDICRAFSLLYSSFGPFTARGLDRESAAAVQAEPAWMEFAVKMRAMYDLVNLVLPPEEGDNWISSWFSGMTPEEVYSMALDCCEYYMPLETSAVTWTSPADIPSAVGQVSYTWYSGLSVTESVRELMRAFRDNGIDVWICTGSFADVIRAAVDAGGIHDCVTGLLGMINRTDSQGRYVSCYDYDTGCGWLSTENGGWKRDTLPLRARPHRAGKTDAIVNILVKRYGHGPDAGFMDSTGDFYFCTEFASMKLAVCMNRADRSIRNGGGLIAATALYQRDILGYDLNTANAAGDTLYLLQGRDENGPRTLRNSNASVQLGFSGEKMFMENDNHRLLEYLSSSGFSTEEILNTFSRRTPADSSGNGTGLSYGFLTQYRGYHSFV